MKNPRKSTGFALISTLAVLVAVAILITAFVSTMRTERIASHNYSEQRQAQALAQGMLNRILAEHAGMAAPYEVDSDTKQPTTPTKSIYLANQPAEGIFRMEPQDDVDTDNHLVRLSGGGAGEAAYQPEDWAYLRLKDPAYGNTFLPKDSSGNPAAPEWIDYTLPGPGGGIVGQVAFAIWEEGGKFDVNILGKDEAINGVAPHDLQIEQELGVSGATTWLNGDTDPARQRNNFSLRKISIESNDNTDNTGDDRRFFSIEELLQKGWATPASAIGLTTFSRDFDVRPEWDGRREADKAKTFLRSYINNPDLYRLMADPTAGKAGPSLVMATMEENQLIQRLQSNQFPVTDSWMQIMRLLAALRLSLPPFGEPPARATTQAVYPDQWTKEDIWGIALNIVQASDTISDENLIAKDETQGAPPLYLQPNTRYGVRICPFITEIAFKVEYGGSSGKVKVTEYIELWNPYPVDLSNDEYILGETPGGVWPSPTGGLVDRKRYAKDVSGPGPGQFQVVRWITRPGEGGTSDMVLSQQGSEGQDGSGVYGLRLRASPYLTAKKYYDVPLTSTPGPWNYPCSRGPHYSATGSGDIANDYNVTAWIPASKIPKSDAAPPVWYSFQIDDPRMGAFTRYSPKGQWKQNWADGEGNKLDGDWEYTWQGYFNKHSLAGMGGDSEYNGKVFNGVDGYNANFGDNWPESWLDDTIGLNRALATFALPGRPFRNVGELGAVFAVRPWRTLSFAQTIAPEDDNLKPDPNAEPQDYPTALLDYLTTVGTTSESRVLNYKNSGTAPSAGLVQENVDKRKQDMRWLFESVDTDGNPTGNIRPIRGRINLNTADEATLATLLKAPYRMVNSLGLKNWSGFENIDANTYSPDLAVTIQATDAAAIARAIVDPASGVRPLRGLFDLRKLQDAGVLQPLYQKYPESVVDAIMGRLAQFGTIRQQIYTVDILARTLNPKAKAKGQDVVTAEVRLLARVYFDTFSRQAFIESMEYR